jgi:hypothetical protein
MKSNSSSTGKFLAISRAALFIGVVSFVPAANAADAVVQNMGNIAYVSGGVGDESIERLNSMRDRFNLKLVFALKSGAYLSDVHTVIANAKGATLLDTTSDGPWLLTRLPAGSYEVVASSAGVTKKRQVSVAATGMKTVDFRWDSDQ